jgi:hypothetical protein
LNPKVDFELFRRKRRRLKLKEGEVSVTFVWFFSWERQRAKDFDWMASSGKISTTYRNAPVSFYAY